MQKYKSFNLKGYIFKKNIIPKSYIKQVKLDMLSLMKNYVRLEKKASLDKKLDIAFNDITKKSLKLRSNIYKAFNRLYSIPKIIFNKNFENFLKNELKFKQPSLVGYSILAMEPKENRFLFNLHQDLRSQYISNFAANIWVPLNSGSNIGGMGLFEKSFERGPLKHKTSKLNGHEEISYECTRNYKEFKITDLKIGDCWIFSPFLIHYSIPNNGTKIRWTARLVIEDLAKASHLENSLEPYNREMYCSLESNEQRLNRILGKFKGGH